MNLRRVTVLGATGSVGRSTLDVLARHPQRYAVHALTAQRDDAGLLALCRLHRPQRAVLVEVDAAERLRSACAAERLDVDVLSGSAALAEVAREGEVQLVMSAIVGAAGLLPTLAAVRAGKTVLIANKEPLVMAGRLLMDALRTSGATLLPIDSEHNAIFQCLPTGYRCGTPPVGVRRLILTASGGPFRGWSAEQLSSASAEQAVRHPNWTMGRKISVDSATLMNKGLELIEAATLYGVAETAVDVLVHPQSVIHSLVEYLDGSLLAQLGQPDMRVPIAHALAWPERVESGVSGLDLAHLGRLNFEPPDEQRFPCLRLARTALRSGGGAANVLNAANEIAVEAFLAGRIGFTAIARLIEDCLAAGLGGQGAADTDLDAILDLDRRARSWCAQRLAAGVRN